MRRVILDTNIYGRIVIDTDIDELVEIIKSKVVVYGSDVIRKEIRRAPRWTRKYPRNLKMDLLRLYDSLANHTIQVTPEILKLADMYFLTYSNLGGRLKKESILSDLIIVACASEKGLDIIVSEDSHTMLDANFQKVYRIVNGIVGKKNPGFLNYAEFKTALRRSL